MSLTKDLLMLSRLRYQPDLILAGDTRIVPLASKQLSPIVQHNPQEVRELISGNNLQLDTNSPEFVNFTRWEQTLIGQRRAVADWLRLQLYGVLWAATGVDQVYPEKYDPPQRDLTAEEDFYGLEPPTLHESDLAFDVLEAGVKLASDVPVMIVNEPSISATGRTAISVIILLPRWIFDQYRQAMRYGLMRMTGCTWTYGTWCPRMNLPTAPFTSPRQVKTCWLSRLPV
jgi:hypothetical protein